MKKLSKILVDPAILVGKPIIAGTRIPVDLIVRLLGQGTSIEEILHDYPQLTKEDVHAALFYSADVVGSESVLPLLKEKRHV